MAADFSSALQLVDTALAEKADQVWVIGGSSLYKVPHGKHAGCWIVVEFYSCHTPVFISSMSPSILTPSDMSDLDYTDLQFVGTEVFSNSSIVCEIFTVV